MKSALSYLSASALALSVCACGSKARSQEGDGDTETNSATSDTASTDDNGTGGASGGSQSATGGNGTGATDSGDGDSDGSGGGGGGIDNPDEGSGGAIADPAQKSAGCDAATSLASGKHSLDVDGESREYILDVPDNYDPSHPYRLIFGFHGMMYDAEWVANGEEPLTGPYFGMKDESAGSAIFVAPQALSSSWSNQDGRDIAYVEAMVAELSAHLCVDEARIFAAGFSRGAIMTATIGCELYDIFRAVAPMSASLPSSCSDSLPALAYWGSHGLQDSSISPEQGELVRDSYLSRNHCESTGSSPDANGCISYDDCDEGEPVVWCTFEGAHVPAPFAGTAIWDFFSQF